MKPRHVWLRLRTMECIIDIENLKHYEDWPSYRKRAKILAEELLYAVTEWEKYYPDSKE
jgi:hypothetical protein